MVANSGIEKNTARVHPQRQAEINDELRVLVESPSVPRRLKKKLGYSYHEPKWAQLSESELGPYLHLLPGISAKRIVFTLRMNWSTEVALRVLRGEGVAEMDLSQFRENQRGKVKELVGGGKVLEVLGVIMNTQHELLRDLYDVSLPQLERLREAMLNAGALGVKLSGAGESLVSPVGDEEEGKRVLSSALSAGARGCWVLRLDEGAKLE